MNFYKRYHQRFIFKKRKRPEPKQLPILVHVSKVNEANCKSPFEKETNINYESQNNQTKKNNK